ncbi:inositol-trisphosphate 3-kinase A [Thalassophryne amazonica]|uniref:inositol-trisphosphate 3-kinase A n=1 Tax=Thalassophryne amazonica TaxID=390379 RepID=UPI00147087D8|nr:inositol-trisphosphate 3-kinase A [Thalassophryne amazonica]
MDTEVMETDNKQTTDNDFSTSTSEETNQQTSISREVFGSCGRVKVRPKLSSTKSFPPYSQRVGGLGQDREWDENPQPSIACNPSPSCEDRNAEELNTGCTEEELPATRRMRRKEKLESSHEGDTDRWKRGKISVRRSVEETERNKGCDETEWDKPRKADWKLHGDLDSEREARHPQKKTSLNSTTEGEGEENHRGMREERLESYQRPSPHPTLSKLFHSSSNSSSSSISLSSPESDEVFSEAEDASSKRKSFRKCRSWKTFLTMMHWSVRWQSSWVQLAGHQGNFQLSEGGEVLKLYSEAEAKCLDYLMRDPLRPFVPQYHGLVTRGEHSYIRLEDLLSGLRRPVIMDCKMGVRTYQEEELLKARNKATLRSDMYYKMMKLDPTAPSAEEHTQKGVTKWRYLQWRDTTTSTSTLGVRIEAIMMEDGSVQRDFRKILTLAQITEALLFFTGSQLHILKAYHSRLLALSDALINSAFFKTHEVIGSSLLFVHDHSSKASVWMIDFGKTTPVPDVTEIRHDIPWSEGSMEDGYLIGLTSLTTSLDKAISVAAVEETRMFNAVD